MDNNDLIWDNFNKQGNNKKEPFIRKGRKAFLPWYHPNLFILDAYGGPEGARTPDLIHAMDALFQLRYRPISASSC